LIAGINTDHVRLNDCRFFAESVFKHRFDYGHVDAKQVSQGADINHVALLGAQRRGRDQFSDQFIGGKADVLNAIPFQICRQRRGIIVQNQTAIAHPVNVFGGGRVIEHDHDIDDILAAQIPIGVGPNLIPGR